MPLRSNRIDRIDHGVAGPPVSCPVGGGDGGVRMEATSIMGHRA